MGLLNILQLTRELTETKELLVQNVISTVVEKPMTRWRLSKDVTNSSLSRGRKDMTVIHMVNCCN